MPIELISTQVIVKPNHMVTTSDHVKGRGLARKDSACCEVFLRKGKGAKGTSAQKFSL
jgi:hypothetical protein